MSKNTERNIDMMEQEEFEKWYQKNQQSGCRLAYLDKISACNLCYTIGFLSCQFEKEANHAHEADSSLEDHLIFEHDLERGR